MVDNGGRWVLYLCKRNGSQGLVSAFLLQPTIPKLGTDCASCFHPLKWNIALLKGLIIECTACHMTRNIFADLLCQMPKRVACRP